MASRATSITSGPVMIAPVPLPCRDEKNQIGIRMISS
jgi:hypothetical protein